MLFHHVARCSSAAKPGFGHAGRFDSEQSDAAPDHSARPARFAVGIRAIFGEFGHPLTRGSLAPHRDILQYRYGEAYLAETCEAGQHVTVLCL